MRRWPASSRREHCLSVKSAWQRSEFRSTTRSPEPAQQRQPGSRHRTVHLWQGQLWDRLALGRRRSTGRGSIAQWSHAVTRTQRPIDGTRLALRMNSRYQPGGARSAFGGMSTLITPAPMPLTTHSRPRCDMLKPCVTVPERSRTTSAASAALGVLMLNVVP